MGKALYIRDIPQYAGQNRADEDSLRGHSPQFKKGTVYQNQSCQRRQCIVGRTFSRQQRYMIKLPFSTKVVITHCYLSTYQFYFFAANHGTFLELCTRCDKGIGGIPCPKPGLTDPVHRNLEVKSPKRRHE
jgi:hypothetical protein